MNGILKANHVWSNFVRDCSTSERVRKVIWWTIICAMYNVGFCEQSNSHSIDRLLHLTRLKQTIDHPNLYTNAFVTSCVGFDSGDLAQSKDRILKREKWFHGHEQQSEQLYKYVKLSNVGGRTWAHWSQKRGAESCHMSPPKLSTQCATDN